MLQRLLSTDRLVPERDCETIQQHLDVFRKTYEHLAPGGCFVVDVFVPGQSSNGTPLSVGEVCDLPDEARGRLVFYGTGQYNRYTQTSIRQNIVEHFFSFGGSERYFTQFSAHHFYPNELQLLFMTSSFSIEAIYGDYSWVSFGEGPRQIVIGSKPA